MASKIMDVVEGLKDKVLPSPTYKTVVTSFDDSESFAAALVKGDFVKGNAATVAIPHSGIKPGTTHEVERVDGQTVVLKGGKKIMAEWFVPEVTRRERVRTKVARSALADMAVEFAESRWADFKTRVDAEIAAAVAQADAAAAGVSLAQNKLMQANSAVSRLKKSKADGAAWPMDLSMKLLALVDQKLYTNFERVQEGGRDVLVLYTGPVWTSLRDGGDKVIPDREKVRGEYAVKVYPNGSPLRIVVENVAPGKIASDVPHNQLTTGACNICFGGQNDELARLIQGEEWARALTMVHAFLDGNRLN